jgi:hypothetical protein
MLLSVGLLGFSICILVLFQGVGKGISNKFQIGLLPFGLRAKR